MGLSFHYSARIREPQLIASLTEEVADICESLKWDYRLWDDSITAPLPILTETTNQHVLLKGISFLPPESETIWLTFAPSGRLLSLINIFAADIYLEQLEDSESIYTTSVKTQSAGVDTHIAILTLLKYLEKKYLTDMDVNDEGYYWKTMNKAVLEKRFAEYEGLLEKVTGIIASATFTDDASSLTDQLVVLLRKRLEE